MIRINASKDRRARQTVVYDTMPGGYIRASRQLSNRELAEMTRQCKLQLIEERLERITTKARADAARLAKESRDRALLRVEGLNVRLALIANDRKYDIARAGTIRRRSSD